MDELRFKDAEFAFIVYILSSFFVELFWEDKCQQRIKFPFTSGFRDLNNSLCKTEFKYMYNTCVYII